MARPTFADPKTDFVFKRIFGSEEHKDVLVAFLNDMLDLDESHRIVGVELLPPEQRPSVAELKLSIVDVKCTDAHGVTYVVEMQVLQVEGFEKRVVNNVAKAYVNQIARGEGSTARPRSQRDQHPAGGAVGDELGQHSQPGRDVRVERPWRQLEARNPRVPSSGSCPALLYRAGSRGAARCVAEVDDRAVVVTSRRPLGPCLTF
jgi:PD-(D/E)XK nuclease-like transposase